MKFSKTSAARLDTCTAYIKEVFTEAIKISKIDFGVAQGERTVEQQRQYFNEGKSKVNPDAYTPEELPLKGKHITNGIYTKAGAVDIYAYLPGTGASWDKSHLCYIAGLVMAIDAQKENRLRWGGNWDGDGVIINDQGFQDLPHFEEKDRENHKI